MPNFLNNRGNANNPAPQQVSSQNNNAQSLAQFAKSMKNMNSPQALIQMFGGNAQNIQKAQAIMKSGNNPQQLAMNLMKERGIDFNEFMKMMNS